MKVTLLSLLLLVMVESTDADQSSTLSKTLDRLAQVQVMTRLCEEEGPAVAGHTREAYEDWLARNPGALEALHWLDVGPDTPEKAEQSRAFEHHQRVLNIELRAIWHEDPTRFAAGCDRFVKALAAGDLDLAP
jgi:hypothetical protein